MSAPTLTGMRTHALGVVALAGAALALMWFLGVEVQAAHDYLTGNIGYRPPDPDAPPDWDTFKQHVVAGFGALAVLPFTRRVAELPAAVPRPAWRFVRATPFALAIMSAVAVSTAVLVDLTTDPADPTAVTGTLHGERAVAYVARIATAGLAEEPIFVLLPFLALTFFARTGDAAPAPRERGPAPLWPAGFPATRAVLILALGSGVLRGVFHVYQGLPYAAAAVLWGGTMVVVYARWRSITALIVAHGIFNVAWVYLLPALGIGGWAGVATMIGLPGALWLAVLAAGQRRDRAA
ncbi:CPBP family intramembrane glutamic endopeptidase [Tsukamurella spumae]|uniref:CPBP family intramembrane metalloprotease n=1 Tax=Tsukamurella spumae TaxID=44753 RepID=A0A846X1L2_9ACTN|nr:CPBP family intramembrane glutamic endopeptidase [Tsukamurella spumae]NKY19477.1 CPBP family intramembrane metalloprotease [Tsukamurella spumae]